MEGLALASLIRPHSALAELAPAFLSCVLPSLQAGYPPCPGPNPDNQAPAEGVDDGQIAQHPREAHQQDHCAQGVVGMVRDINRGEGDPGSSLSPGCLQKDRSEASHYPVSFQWP